MNTAALSLTLFAMIFASTLLKAGDFPHMVVPVDGVDSITNYQHQATRINDIIVQTASPQQIETALQSVLDTNSLHNASDADWTYIRSNMASTIFTNLALLEVGLRRTSTVTNINITPIAINEYVVDPNEVTDTAQRQQLVACRSALKAYGELWNLHQALQAEYSRHWDRSIHLLISLYSQQPPADAEIKKLLADYAGYDFTLQFSNQLCSMQNN
jgi:hypothetical protein